MRLAVILAGTAALAAGAALAQDVVVMRRVVAPRRPVATPTPTPTSTPKAASSVSCSSTPVRRGATSGGTAISGPAVSSLSQALGFCESALKPYAAQAASFRCYWNGVTGSGGSLIASYYSGQVTYGTVENISAPAANYVCTAQ